MKRHTRLISDIPVSRYALPDLAHAARHDVEDRLLVDRWVRLTLIVRCALVPADANQVRLLIACAQRVVSEGLCPPLAMQFRLLQTLLQTSSDPMIPPAWRAVCAEHLDQPMARLDSLLGPPERAAAQSLHAAVEKARNGSLRD